MPIPEYNKVYGGMKDDNGYSIAPTRDGGFVIAGTTSSNNGDVSGNHGYVDIWVVKKDASGNMIWQKTFGGSDNDAASSIVVTSDGGYAVAGVTNSNDEDVSGNHGKADVWVIKIDADGKLLWQKTFGGTETDAARSITETTDGGFAIAGYTNSNNGDIKGRLHGTAYDAWIFKISGIGNLQWQHPLGGTDNDYANSVLVTADGGITFSGQTGSNNGNVSGNHGSNDMWIVRLKENGDSLWRRTIGGLRDENANCMVTTSDAGFVIAGVTNSKDGNISGVYDTSGKTIDVCLAKIDQDAKLAWIKIFGGSGNETANAVIATSDGGFLLTGETNSVNGDVTSSKGGTDAWVLKVDARGNKQWQQSVGGSGTDVGYALAEIPRKGYIMAGSTSSNDGDILFNRGGFDVLIATFKNDY